ncbi:restriction endonuclease subunit S [Ureaplasma canigenitalium]|uniref:restriction endonuclease subunit S n=1 Tax=Ureaplasma canigenitalium TaxID=42092 RepID=UPI0004E2362E|nr:restriction endonuclease subunit S [Ureaplasma canigenitalium]
MIEINNNWRFFELKELFTIERSKNVTIEDAKDFIGYTIPYITRTENDNGTNFFISDDGEFPLEKGNCITIGGEGAQIFYQPIDFITGNNITKLYNIHLNENIALFIVSVLRLEKFRYSYNRPFNQDFIKKTKIKLPALIREGNIIPDWDYMDKYIRELRERERERELWNFSILVKVKTFMVNVWNGIVSS